MNTPEKARPVIAVPVYLPGSIAKRPKVLVRRMDIQTPISATQITARTNPTS